MLWPNYVIVCGQPRHPQIQGSVERANQVVEVMVGKWMMIHNATEWSVGIHPVAYQKTVAGIGQLKILRTTWYMA